MGHGKNLSRHLMRTVTGLASFHSDCNRTQSDTLIETFLDHIMTFNSDYISKTWSDILTEAFLSHIFLDQ